MFDKTPELHDHIYAFKDHKAEADALLKIIRLRAPRARRLLDVACGYRITSCLRSPI